MIKKISLVLAISLFVFTGHAKAENMFLDNELLASASRGEYSNIKEIIQSGGNIKAVDMFGNNALILAADGGYVDVILLLLKSGINIDVKNKYGYTALLSAITNYHKDSTYVLYKAGANPNIPNKYNTTANTFVKSLGYKNIWDFAKDNKSEKPSIYPDMDKGNTSSFSSYYNSSWREYYNELVDKRETEKAYNLLLAYAESNDPEACYMLGKEYLMKKDTVKAYEWLDKAARYGSCVTKYRAAKLILNVSEGVETIRPIQMLKDSIKEGCYLGKVEYGKLLYFGIGVEKNFVESYKLFSDAAKYKLPEAIFFTGLSEYLGRGVPVNKEEGMNKIRQAKSLGYSKAYDAMQSIDAEETLNIFSSYDPSKRNMIKTELLTSGFIIEDGKDEICDTFKSTTSLEKAYNVERIRLCYPQNGNPTQEFILKDELDSIQSEYLKVKIPNVQIKVAKKAIPEKKEKFNPEIINKRKFFDFVIGDDKLITPVVIGENEKNNNTEVNNDEYSIVINVSNEDNIEAERLKKSFKEDEEKNKHNNDNSTNGDLNLKGNIQGDNTIDNKIQKNSTNDISSIEQNHIIEQSEESKLLDQKLDAHYKAGINGTAEVKGTVVLKDISDNTTDNIMASIVDNKSAKKEEITLEKIIEKYKHIPRADKMNVIGMESDNNKLLSLDEVEKLNKDNSKLVENNLNNEPKLAAVDNNKESVKDNNEKKVIVSENNSLENNSLENNNIQNQDSDSKNPNYKEVANVEDINSKNPENLKDNDKTLMKENEKVAENNVESVETENNKYGVTSINLEISEFNNRNRPILVKK